jgi:hypothetical protein
MGGKLELCQVNCNRIGNLEANLPAGKRKGKIVEGKAIAAEEASLIPTKS